MDLSSLWSSLQTNLGAQLPSIMGAIAILIVGWLIAVLARAGARRLLGALKVNQRIRESTEHAVDVESTVAIGVFWLIVLATIVAALNSLHLEQISSPLAGLVGKILGYLPHLIAGTALLLIAWLVAMVLRSVVARVLAATTLDERLAKEAGMQPISRSAANMLFWLVLLLFLPAVLSAYEMRGLLEPVQQMLTKLLDIVPNIFSALVIGFVGWLVARVLRGLVTNLLAAAGADRIGTSVGLAESVRVSRLAGTLAFIFVFVPSLIAALDALKLEAISRPATDMLSRMLAAVPDIFAAGLILVITWYVAKFVGSLVSRLLNGMGFDAIPAKLGVRHALPEAARPSSLVGWIVMLFAMLFATVEAGSRLGFTQVRDVVTMFIEFAGDVILGGVIFVIGFWLANLAYEAIDRASGEKSTGLASIARAAILGLVIAMGLRAMGIADDIVNLAFGLTLGAVAVAVALSFGLGGREAAGRQMEYWLAKMRKPD